MEFWVPFGYHVMAVYRFKRKEIMVNYAFMGSLQPYVCVPMVPQVVPKIVRCKNIIFRLSNALSIAFIRLLHDILHFMKIKLKIPIFEKSRI